MFLNLQTILRRLSTFYKHFKKSSMSVTLQFSFIAFFLTLLKRGRIYSKTPHYKMLQ